ncbi:MAG: hypothetical protein AAGG68_21170 [Bacteroidota bacterium]
MEENKITNEENPAETNAFVEFLKRTYRKFNVFSEIKKEDAIPIMILKIIVRIIGLLFLIALSPFLIIGLMIAFLAAA